MSVKDEIQKSGKLDAATHAAVASVPDSTDPDQPYLSLFLTLNSDQPLVIPGVDINGTTGTVRTANNVSLNGLKALIDCPQTKFLRSAQRLRTSSPAPAP